MERFEYKPDITYTNPDHESIPARDILDSEEISHLYDLTIAEVWDHIDQLLGDTNRLVYRIEANVGTLVTRIQHPETWEILDSLKLKYGDQSPAEHMSFDLYKRIFTSDDPYDQMVAAAFQGAHTGIGGLAEVEAYPIAVDMMKEAEIIARLTKNTALNLSDPSITAQTDNTAVQDMIKQRVLSLEKKRLKEVIDIQGRLAEIRREIERGEFNEEPSEYKALNSKLNLILDEEQTIAELKDVISDRTDKVQIAADSMSSVLFEPPLKSEKSDLAKHLLRSDKIQGNIDHIQDLCELLCAEKTDEIRQARSQLAGTGIPQSSLERSLTAMSHYRNKIAAPVADWLDDITVDTIEGNIVAKEALDELAKIFGASLAFAEAEYKEALMGIKGLSESTARLRQMCIHALQDKQQARAAHSLLNELNHELAQDTDQGGLVRWANNL